MDQNTNFISRRFLLMEGGPLVQLQKRIGLIKRTAPSQKRRAVLAALITWVPLLVLSQMQGLAYGHAIPVPFLSDFGVYTRFLLAVPLLLLAENILGPRFADAAALFVTSGVIPEKNYQQFDKYVELGLRSRDSVVAEVVIAVLAYIFSTLSFLGIGNQVSTWYRIVSVRGASLTWAGYWFVGFCQPFCWFLVMRWFWRFFLWFKFLGRVCKLDMQLFPTHPDEAGGLGFVGEAQRYFGVILFALSLATVGVLARSIVYDHIPLATYGPLIATYVVVAVVTVIGPLAVFAGVLYKTKRLGLQQYGTLATSYTGSFHHKWINHQGPQREPLLGTDDVQSLADLGNSFGFIKKMKPLPLDLRDLMYLVVASLLPLTPLLLSIMSPKDLLKLLFKVLG
jgi:hypothetical protein